MTVRPQNIQPLNPDELPPEARSWAERVLVIPLNRTLDTIRTLLTNGVTLQTHINAQVVERVFVAPSGSDWSADRLDTVLDLTGAVVGVQPLSVMTVDGAGHDLAPVGGAGMPVWREVAINGRRLLRIIHQDSLTAGTRYRVKWLAWGGPT